MTVYVREYADIGVTHSKYMQAGAEPALTDQVIANAAGTVEIPNPFDANTRMVAVHTDAIISLRFGVPDDVGTISAVTVDFRMAADTTMFFGVRPGGTMAVIDNT